MGLGPHVHLLGRVSDWGRVRADFLGSSVKSGNDRWIYLSQGCGGRGNGDAGGRASSETFAYTRPELPPVLKSSRLPRLQQWLGWMFLRP